MSVPRLTLRIVNVEALPDGGPLAHSVQGQGFQAGRNPVMAWVLPDPAKRISGEHVRIHYQGGVYWLQDVSKNGTLINGLPLEGMRPLNAGDQIGIGHYRIRVEIESAPLAADSDPESDPGAAQGQTQIAAFAQPSAGPSAGLSAGPSSPQVAAPSAFAAEGHSTHWAPHLGASPAAAPRDPGPAALLNAIARGAGLAPGIFSGQDPEALGEEIGQVLRILAEQMIGLLAVRATTKKIIRSRNKTRVTPQGNNPLKTGPDAEAVLLQFFIQRSGYFLTASEALREGFADLRQHQSASYAAMQSALAELVEDFSPARIEAEVRPRLVGSTSARAWARYKADWEARSRDQGKGMFELFLAHFVEAYDRNTQRPSEAAAKGAPPESAPPRPPRARS